MIFDALGVLALGEIPQEVTPTPTPVVAVPRVSGGKLIAAFTIDNNGKLRRDIQNLIEAETKEDEEIMTSLLAYWRSRDN